MSSISRPESRISIRRNRSKPPQKPPFVQDSQNIRRHPALTNCGHAIADKLKAEQGLQYEKSQILVSCGAKHSLYNIAEALLEAGDELIIPVPFWVSYQDQDAAQRCDADPSADTRGGWICHSRKTRSNRRHPRTKAIIVNSPVQPDRCHL